MELVIQELRQIVEEYSKKFSSLSKEEIYHKPLPNKWSKIEVLGHLIDSGLNNHRRFVCGQYEQSPPKIVYNQDYWVKVNNYQHSGKDEIVSLWKLVNEQICQVLATMHKENYSKTCDTGKSEIQLHTLEWLAVDYVKHMKHHLNQIFSGSFDVIYT